MKAETLQQQVKLLKEALKIMHDAMKLVISDPIIKKMIIQRYDSILTVQYERMQQVEQALSTLEEQEGKEAITDEEIKTYFNNHSRNYVGNMPVITRSETIAMIRHFESRMQSPAPTHRDEHTCPDCRKVLKPIYLCTDCVEDTFNKRGIYSKATKHPEK